MNSILTKIRIPETELDVLFMKLFKSGAELSIYVKCQHLHTVKTDQLESVVFCLAVTS